MELLALAIAIATLAVTVATRHNQRRFERAQNARWNVLLERLRIADPVDDDGQIDT